MEAGALTGSAAEQAATLVVVVVASPAFLLMWLKEWYDERSHSASTHPVDLQSVAGAEQVLNALARRVPPRIANEEIGDALEVIHSMAKEGQSARAIHFKVARTYVWVGLHTAAYYAERLLGLAKIATGKGDDKQ